MSFQEKKSSPKISVILPVYNGEVYLAKAIESVLNQSFTDFEFIIINDGSTDKTRDIIDSYCTDSRLKVFHQDNIGLIKTLNKGLGLAKSNLVARLDADDVCHNNRFEVQYSRFYNDQSLSVLGSSIRLINEDDQPIRQVDYPKFHEVDSFIKKGSPVAHPAVMMKRQDVIDIGGYRDAFESAEDYDLWFRLHDAGYKIDNCEEVLIDYRQTLSGISFSQSDKQTVVTRLVQLAHDMRATNGKDSFNGSKAIGINELRVELGRFIRSDELAKYELIWFGCYHLNSELLDEFDIMFERYRNEFSIESKALYFLKRAYVSRTNGNQLSFLSDLTKSFIASPSLVLSVLKTRFKE